MFSNLNTWQPSILAISDVRESSESLTPQKEAELRQAAQEFEASYIAQMLTFSGLDKALMAGGGQDVEAFTSFYIESFADQIAENGGFGLAENFYDRMVKFSGLAPENDGESSHVDFGKM